MKSFFIHRFPPLSAKNLSWIAFDINDPVNRRIIFDNHPPKGPHFHAQSGETKFEWRGLDKAIQLFINVAVNEFGMHSDLLKLLWDVSEPI